MSEVTNNNNITIEEFMDAIKMAHLDKSKLLSYMKENELELGDLLECKEKKDLIDAGINQVIDSLGLDQLWNGIKQLSQMQITQTQSNKTFSESSIPTNTVTKNLGNLEGGIVGLENLTNTCFMNSAIQCLLNMPGFTNELVNEINELLAVQTVSAMTNSNNNNDEIESEKSESDINIDKNRWWSKLNIGHKLDVFDRSAKNWFVGEVKDIGKYNKSNDWWLDVHYIGFNPKYDETIDITNEFNLIDPIGTHWRCTMKKGDKIDYYSRVDRKWIVSTVIEARCVSGYKIKYGKGKWQVDDVAAKGADSNTNIAKLGTKTNKLKKNKNKNSNGFNYKNSKNESNSFLSYLNPYSYFNGNVSENSKGARDIANFYNAWLDLVHVVHVDKNCETFSPYVIKNLMGSYNNELGDGGQHDAIEALRVILHGIEMSLPQKFNFSKKYQIKDNMYILPIGKDKDYGNMKTDLAVIKNLKETNIFGYDTNLVSKYFDGIQVTQETCLNCNYQRRIYNKFRELLLPVTETYISIQVLYFQTKKQAFDSITLKLPENCDIKWLKFLILNQIFRETNLFSKMNMFRILKLNQIVTGFTEFAQILDETWLLMQVMQDIESKTSCLLLVPNIELNNNINHKPTSHGSIKSNVEKYESLYLYISDNKHLVPCLFTLPQSHYTLKLLQIYLSQKRKNFGTKFVSNTTKYHSEWITYALTNVATSASDRCVLYTNGKLRTKRTDVFNLFESKDENTNIIINFERSLEVVSKPQIMSKLNDEIYSIKVQLQHLKTSEKSQFIKNVIKNLQEESESLERNFNYNLSQKLKVQFDAYSELLSEMEQFECDRKNSLNCLKESIQNIWISNELNKANKNGKYYQAAECKTIKNCWNCYWSESNVLRENLIGKFECECTDEKNEFGGCNYIKSTRDIVVLPKLLILSLERGSGSNKNDHTVNFSEKIKFDSCGSSCTLRAVCNHFGGTAKFGHYTAHVKKIGTSKKWFECDDSYIRESNYSCQNAIMMIYSKVDQ